MYGLAVAATLLISNQTRELPIRGNIYYRQRRKRTTIPSDKTMAEIYALCKDLARLVEIMEKLSVEQHHSVDGREARDAEKNQKR